MAAERPPANLHLKLFALLFYRIALLFTAKIEELLVAELVDVLGSGYTDLKFVYAELHIEVHALKEVINILNISLAL